MHSSRYLLFELAWALPVLALQWLIGWRMLLKAWKQWLVILVGLIIYFTAADALAIQQHIWQFDATALVGVYVGNVPLEEVLFYALTSTMILQGMLLGWFFLQDRKAFMRSALPWRKGIPAETLPKMPASNRNKEMRAMQ